jgi:murein DD-endopeptidase MepM/ murein hydrolase activator NlpD
LNTTLFMNFQVLTYLFISLISAPDVQTLSNNLNNKVITYPKGEFVFPINPGRRASLSGSYGDIRFNHFHAGLDIRTGGVEGVAVHSAGDGYVSRIGVSGGGYGNALYITHPNGYTTVYGHLKEFGDRIKGKLLEREYQQQSWAIDTYFQPGEIPVSKGEVVAFSGNTGGSKYETKQNKLSIHLCLVLKK